MQTAHEKYVDHPLFKECIEISCPQGWMRFLDEAVAEIEKINLSSPKSKIGFGQVKVKFGKLTIYLDNYGPERNSVGRQAYDVVSKICSKAEDFCQVCGKGKTEMVIETRVRKVCFDHLQNFRSSWAWRNGEV